MKIGIFGHYYKKDASKYIEELLQVLEDNNVDVVIEEQFCSFIEEQNNLQKKYATFSSYYDIDKNLDMLFTVGGDGTFLRSIVYIRDLNIPILGINFGRLGFLAMVPKQKIKIIIQAVLNKKYSIKERSLLSVSTKPQIDDFQELNFALNEITIVRKNTTAMITIETVLDDEYLTSYWADGLIVATPTGSTGYSLSCGGPVIAPTSKNIVLTPIAPHNLNARPLVIPDHTKIKLKIVGREKIALISLDSRISNITNNTEVTIEKTPFTIKFVELHNQTFFKTLRGKLLWGEDLRNN
jgi:NAD+ kinase